MTTKACKYLILFLMLSPAALRGQASPPGDWANLQRFREANAQLPQPRVGERRVVFMGNSITQQWDLAASFPGMPYINRGISGQTTPQMLLRFRQDVVALKPAIVVILAGTNDIAGNTGPSTLDMIADNIKSMTEIAHANGIRVVLSSVLPAIEYRWKKDERPAPRIVALNRMLREYADEVGAVYIDFHTAMRDDRDGLAPQFTTDGVHVTPAGYRVMSELIQKALP